VPRRRDARLVLGVFVTSLVLVSAYIVADPVSVGPASALDRADLASSAITSLGLLAAGLWALFTFVLFRSGVTNLEMTIRPQVQPLRADSRMLMIDVGLRNTGKVMVEAGAMGCRIWLRHLPIDAEIGQPVDLDGGNVVVDGLDLLADYDKRFPYEIEPGAEYHEFCAVPVNRGALFSVRATFYLGGEEDDAISERRLAFVE
jgi:hypothetical protein